MPTTLKWQKPEKIQELIEKLHNTGKFTEEQIAKWLRDSENTTKYIVNPWRRRMRLRNEMADKNGNIKPIPEYTKSYIKQKSKKGLPDRPNNTLSGTLLDNIGVKIRAGKGDGVEFVGMPFGRSVNLRAFWGRMKEIPKVENGKYWREPYSYVDQQGMLIQVPGKWITISQQMQQKFEAVIKYNNIKLSNQDLARYLGNRLGAGKWQRGGKPANAIFFLASEDLEEVNNAMSKDLQKEVNVYFSVD